MRIERTGTVILLTILLTGAAFMGYADETAEKARAVLEANRDAVITIQAVIGMSFGGNENETEQESNATVIDPTGLSVLALTAVDPSAMFANMGEMASEMVTKVNSLKMLIPDGADVKEVEAEIVLRDKDLDLAYVRPKEKPAEEMAYVDLAKSGAPQLLDEVVVIGQLGKVARRAHTAFVERIEAVVEKPRTFYIPGEHRARAIMCSPVFTMDGEVVGVGVMRAIMAGGGGGGMGDNMMVIIVPAEDIADQVQQVPAFGETPAGDTAASEKEPTAEEGP